MVTGNAGSEPATAVRDESAAEASERLGHRLIGPVIFWLAIVTAVIHLYFNTVSTLSELWSSALHFGLFGLICTLTTPMFNARSVGGQRMVLGVDVMLGLTALVFRPVNSLAHVCYNRNRQTAIKGSHCAQTRSAI